MGNNYFELADGQLRLTSVGYNLCVVPAAERNGADLKGAFCRDAERGWAPGTGSTVAWKGMWCLDNAGGGADVS
jgi:hypothetical protein